ncbi:YceI family protein [Lewinella sp. IMCC34191]|uniref:YceI family protein n=1 Tax=Lewinella sp. IMCC34191 TaxID=2259172 RepID=UPI0013002984|nr:YceI family protein [Lewinella sp. IMCC34191]
MAVKYLVGIMLVFLTVSAGYYDIGNYEIGPDYVIHFSGGGAEGTFSGLTGEITFDPEDLSTARMDVSVEAATIATGNDLKDKHARGENWFDVENYPTISYRATDFERTGSGYLANGTLTLHGVSKSAPIPFNFTKTGKSGRFEGKLTVDRQAFGIEGPWLAFTVGDAFDVELTVPVR